MSYSDWDSTVAEIEQGRFSFELSELPAGKYVRLSDALKLAFFGGVPEIRYDGPISHSLVEGAGLGLTRSGQWMLATESASIPGPRYTEIARPGALMFDIEDSTEPDALQSAAYERWYQARIKRHELQEQEQAAQAAMLGTEPRPSAPTPRRHDPSVIQPFWKAEIGRRRAQFFDTLNVAARSGALRFMGTPVEGDWITEPSNYGSIPQDVPAAYFVEDRGFDEDLDCIDAAGGDAPGPGHEDVPAETGQVSYQDVVVERTSYLRFLRTCYPTVLNPALAQERLKIKEVIPRLGKALSECPNMKKDDAAKIVGLPVRNSRFLNEIWPQARILAGLPPTASGGRKPKSTLS